MHAVRFCWFLHDDEIRAKVEKDYEHFSSAMLHIFRASNLMFSGEYELMEARTFSRKLLEKIVSTSKRCLLPQVKLFKLPLNDLKFCVCDASCMLCSCLTNIIFLSYFDQFQIDSM